MERKEKQRMSLLEVEKNVEIKQKEYYRMIKETAQAELIRNGLRCNVPPHYIKAMISGETEGEIPDQEEAETLAMESFEMELEGSGDWGCLVASVKGILDNWEEESQVQAIADNIRGITEELIKIRVKEVRMKQYAKWARENEEPSLPEGWKEVEGNRRKVHGS